MSKLAERMKELRVENKMKQTEVAKAVGVSISAYCSYEYGNRDPQTATLVALAQLYHVSADYLLGISEPAPEEKARIILASNSPRRKELLGQMGIQEFKVSAPNVDESVAEGLSPARIVEELSQRKARAAKKAGPKNIVTAADTVVALDGLVLGKPRSGEDAAGNAAILDDLERAAQMDPSLPLPRSAYEEVCALAGRKPALPQGPELKEEFLPGYRKDPVTHAIGALRLTLPGAYRYQWERWETGGAHLWTDGDGPVWRVNAYRMREGDARFTDQLNTLHGVEQRELKGGALRWGWHEIREDGQRLYQAQCEVVAGPSLFFLTATCASPEDLGQVADLIGRVAVVSSTAHRETVQAQKE